MIRCGDNDFYSISYLLLEGGQSVPWWTPRPACRFAASSHEAPDKRSNNAINCVSQTGADPYTGETALGSGTQPYTRERADYLLNAMEFWV